MALASVYFEPLWVFHRRDVMLARLSDLRGKRIAIDQEGSGTRAIALQLLQDNAITAIQADVVSLGTQAAAGALRRGELDAMFVVASPQASVVRELLTAEDVALLHFHRAEAYTRLHHFLSSVRLPEGVVDLAQNIPSHPITLLAPTATLVAGPHFHPALVDRLLQAATQVHGRGGLFEQPGEFPSPRFVDFPLSAKAKRYFESGPPFLQRYLPFWAADLIDRLWVMLVPLVALLLPFIRILPPVYEWRVRSRIYRWYRELLAIRAEELGELSQTQYETYIRALDRIEDEVAKISVPLAYAGQLLIYACISSSFDLECGKYIGSWNKRESPSNIAV